MDVFLVLSMNYLGTLLDSVVVFVGENHVYQVEGTPAPTKDYPKAHDATSK